MGASVRPTTFSRISCRGLASSSMRVLRSLSSAISPSIDHRIADGGGDHAGIVEGHGQFAEILAIGVGLDDRHVDAVRVRHHGRIGACGASRRCWTSSVLAVATDDDVDAADGRGDALVDGVAGMAEEHDLRHPLAGQPVDLGADRLDGIGKAHIGAGARQLAGVGGRHADQADRLAVLLDHRRGLQRVGELRLVGDVGIGQQDRELDLFHEGPQNLGPSSNSWLPTVIAS